MPATPKKLNTTEVSVLRALQNGEEMTMREMRDAGAYGDNNTILGLKGEGLIITRVDKVRSKEWPRGKYTYQITEKGKMYLQRFRDGEVRILFERWGPGREGGRG